MMDFSGNFGKRWYIVQTYSGYENAVKQDIERRAETMGLSQFIFNIIVPEETKIIKKTDGSEKKTVKQIFPGYVFIEMIVTDDSWFMVRNTPKVTGFLGSSGGGTKPVPLTAEEIKPILLKMGVIEKPAYDYLLNQNVQITAGPFMGSIGQVTKVDSEKEIVVVNINIFGRSTPAELAIKDIKELNQTSKEEKEDTKEEEPEEKEESTDDDLENYQDEDYEESDEDFEDDELDEEE